jgi:diguanylate cyclase (GGDEF)-like protein
VERAGSTGVDYEAWRQRARLVATPEACEEFLAEIGRELGGVTAAGGRARLLMSRAHVLANQWRMAEVCEDARAAMELFEAAGEADLAIEAASWGAVYAVGVGQLSLAWELAAKIVLALGSVTDDRLRMEITNQLGVFCYECLDFDRAVEQFEASLAAAEQTGDPDLVPRPLFNIAETLLLTYRQKQTAHLEASPDLLERAEATVHRLLSEGTAEINRRFGSHRLLAEVLCELGRVEEALRVLDDFGQAAGAITAAAQRSSLALVEARCLRLSGQEDKGVARAKCAVQFAEVSGDDHELMLAFEELAACEEAAGDLVSALAHAKEVKARMWAVHQRQSRQLVQGVWHHVDLVRDRSNLQAQAAEASRSAEEDELTGLGNRRLLERFLGQVSAGPRDVGFMMVDVDFFKDINDKLGHQVGDAVLRQLGRLLSGQVRAGQVAIRYGGDEFVLALPGIDPGVARRFAERLRLRVLEHDWGTIAPALGVTVSIGVAWGPAADWRAVMAGADASLYAAKQRGRNTVVGAVGAFAAP